MAMVRKLDSVAMVCSGKVCPWGGCPLAGLCWPCAGHVLVWNGRVLDLGGYELAIVWVVQAMGLSGLALSYP
jgi:hypothetical protein